ncbi:tol-pal system protein YbgF [Thermotomaculum hydrothermale]|uniref:Tol-pal system protein YbgF n=1 Tax=Thermotomaculum hydrothermale TaxID=981385 RepID=A0A7R6PEX1_9BACT|nr:tol-pal system protein YbgF [Thermotomaculum hydrothermale]BBB32449.1 tol-pal system protein YbgF [Thermotomaculum hydrothermale]
MKKLVVLLFLPLLLVGCVDNTKSAQDLNDIKDQLWKVQAQQSEELKRLKELEEKVGNNDADNGTNADIVATQQEIQDSVNAILERIKELNDKVTFLLTKISSLENGQASNNSLENNDNQNNTNFSGITNPDALFSQAYADYMKGNYDIAIIEFKDYIAKFPDSEKVDNAYYWLGLCYFEKEKFRDAIDSFDKIIKDYPQSDVLAAAMLKKGLALFEMGAAGMGAVQLQELIEKFPMSKEASIARKKLDALHIAN